MINIEFRWSQPRGDAADSLDELKSVTFDGPSAEVQAKMRGFIAGGIWLERVTIL
jgi:hypothetical protein